MHKEGYLKGYYIHDMIFRPEFEVITEEHKLLSLELQLMPPDSDLHRGSIYFVTVYSFT